MADQGLADVPAQVVARVGDRQAAAYHHLDDAVRRREAAYRELVTSDDPVDQAIARVYRDFLLQVDEVTRTGAAMLLTAGTDGDPVVGRIAVFDGDRDLLVVPWHADEGQRLLTAPDRLLITEHDRRTVSLHRLTAEAEALADRIRTQMRVSAAEERMADPLATLTVEQGEAVRRIAAADGDVRLTGPPGSGKSAILIVELARRILSRPDPRSYRVLFVTGTPRLAVRAEALGRLLGIASIRPVPQEEVLSVLGAGKARTPVAGAAGDGAADGPAVPQAIEAAFTAARDGLFDDAPVPHPLGPTPRSEVAAVRRCRAQAATQSYAASARALADDLSREYEQVLPGERSRQLAAAATEAIRPPLSPSALVGRALPDLRLPRGLRAAATACARLLLEESPGRSRPAWDLVVVDEYQRLPAVVLWLLRRSGATALLSGDPHQSFLTRPENGEVAAAAPTDIRLTTSLRLPASIAAWIDRFWQEQGLPSPTIRSAARGGSIEVADVEAIGDLDGRGQVLAPARQARRRDGWLSPADALGLEWPDVVLVDPEAILAEHGPAGLFVAATRAIDTLTVAATRPHVR